MTAKPRGGLGRGLGALIPTTPIAADAVDRASRRRPEVASDSIAGAGRQPDADHGIAPRSGAGCALRRDPGRLDRAEPEAAAADLRRRRARGVEGVDRRGRVSSADRRARNWARTSTNSSWANAAGVPPRRSAVKSIPAIVRETRDDAMLRDALLENIHRANLNPLEEAAAYQQLLEEFGATHDELARRIGRSRPQISNTIRLLNLPPAVQRRVAAGVLSAGHARALLGLDDAAEQEALAHRIVAEGLSVRATEEIGVAGRVRRTREAVDRGEASGQAACAGADRSRRSAVGPIRHPREGRHRPEQGQDCHRVRDASTTSNASSASSESKTSSRSSLDRSYESGEARIESSIRPRHVVDTRVTAESIHRTYPQDARVPCSYALRAFWPCG